MMIWMLLRKDLREHRVLLAVLACVLAFLGMQLGGLSVVGSRFENVVAPLLQILTLILCGFLGRLLVEKEYSGGTVLHLRVLPVPSSLWWAIKGVTGLLLCSALAAVLLGALAAGAAAQGREFAFDFRLYLNIFVFSAWCWGLAFLFSAAGRWARLLLPLLLALVLWKSEAAWDHVASPFALLGSDALFGSRERLALRLAVCGLETLGLLGLALLPSLGGWARVASFRECRHRLLLWIAVCGSWVLLVRLVESSANQELPLPVLATEASGRALVELVTDSLGQDSALQQAAAGVVRRLDASLERFAEQLKMERMPRVLLHVSHEALPRVVVHKDGETVEAFVRPAEMLAPGLLFSARVLEGIFRSESDGWSGTEPFNVLAQGFSLWWTLQDRDLCPTDFCRRVVALRRGAAADTQGDLPLKWERFRQSVGPCLSAAVAVQAVAAVPQARRVRLARRLLRTPLLPGAFGGLETRLWLRGLSGQEMRLLKGGAGPRPFDAKFAARMLDTGALSAGIELRLEAPLPAGPEGVFASLFSSEPTDLMRYASEERLAHEEIPLRPGALRLSRPLQPGSHARVALSRWDADLLCTVQTPWQEVPQP